MISFTDSMDTYGRSNKQTTTIYYFSVFLSAVSYVIDPITRGKLCIVRGDYSENSENDMLMKYLIGDQWKSITGVDQPRFNDNASPGYNHEVYWKNIVKDGKVL